MKRYSQSFTRVVHLLLVIALLLTFAAPAFAKGGLTVDKSKLVSTREQWQIFVHPEFGFSFSYPPNWIIENNLSRAHPSGTVSIKNLTSALDARGVHQTIEIGLHLVESSGNFSIGDWVTAYDEAMNLLDENLLSFETRRVNEFPSVYKSAESPLTPYEVVTIKRGDVMWFIWGNTTDSSIFSEVVNSFHWLQRDRYLTLSEMGIQATMKLDVASSAFSAPPKAEETTTLSDLYIRTPDGIPGTPEGYRMPFYGSHPITQGPHSYCYPYTHTGNAAKAIDFSMPQGTYVANSSDGWIERNGWNNQGYGNLVGVQDNSNRIAFYAHLQTRTWRSVGSYISQSSWIGSSGNTGNSSGPHLHFHVRTTGGTPIDITGIPTMTFDGNGCTGSAWYTP